MGRATAATMLARHGSTLIRVSTPSVEKLRGGYEALRQGDVDAVLELMDPEIEMRESAAMPGSETYHGHEGFRRWYFERRLEIFDEFGYEPEEFIEAGEHIFVAVRIHLKAKGSDVVLDTTAYHVWTGLDDRAIRFESFTERDEALRAAGLPA